MGTDFAAARRVNAADIPVIDISRLIEHGHTGDVSRAIHEAATQVGFFYLSGHGIAEEKMVSAFDAAQDFFDLPESLKSNVAVSTDQRGWMAGGMSKMRGAATHDLKEVFFWGTDVPEDHPDLLAGKPLIAQNKWPDESISQLRSRLDPYYAEVCEVARKVLSAIAVGFGVPENFFESCFDFPLARGQLVYYPPSSAKDESEQRFGVAPHTDFGVLTFLLQDNSGGLQVKARNGEWLEAPPIPGTLVCNIGDLLQRWTNDRFVSTVHRVINRSNSARYSIPIFFDPNTDTVIDARDLGVEKAKLEPLVAGEHIATRNKKSFAQFQRE